jgi:hypothetical protein
MKYRGEVRAKGEVWMLIRNADVGGQSRWKLVKRGGQIAGVALNFSVDARKYAGMWDESLVATPPTGGRQELSSTRA